MSTVSKPRLLLTMGDPGGIGLELIAKSLSQLGPNWPFIPIIVASKNAIEAPFHQALFNPFTISEDLSSPLQDHTIYVSLISENHDYTIGNHAKNNGLLAYTCLDHAVKMIRSNQADLLCTAPLSKASLHLAKRPYTGHTTCLAAMTNSSTVSMAFSSPELRVLLHSIHIPLHAVSNTITETRLRLSFDNAIKFAHTCGFKLPRIAIAALNPHAGERGKLGFEDSEIISPLIKEYQDRGHDFSGPHPADTVFWNARQNIYDVIVSMYHDQALIPIKTLAFDKAVNVTVGLPFIRTSPDHGTAFDIAYQGTANPSSMIEAILFATHSFSNHA